MASLLPFAVILVCPVVMGLMMFFMMRGRRGSDRD